MNFRPYFRADIQPRYSVSAGKVNRLLLAIFILCGAFYWTQASAFAAQVKMLSSSPEPAELMDAKDALQNGEVVAMQDVKPEDFNGLFNVGVAKSRLASEAGGSYCVIAAGYDQKHIMHTYRGALVSMDNADPDCMTRFQKWADELPAWQADAAAAALPSLVGNGPSGDAWTALLVNTESARNGDIGELQVTYSIYRANSSYPTTDYYTITQQTISTPVFKTCIVMSSCGWLNNSSTYQISASDLNGNVYPLFDHGPLQANNSSTTTYSVGAEISTSPGVSFSYSESYTQSDVTTVDATSTAQNIAAWKNTYLPRSKWSNSWTPPPALQGPWTSFQSAIFKVPVGTSAFNVTLNDTATFDYSSVLTGSVTVADSITVYAPNLIVSPQIVHMVPGQQVSLAVDATIQGSGAAQLSWVITNADTGNNINITPPTGAGSKTVSVRVPAETLYQKEYLSLNTVYPYASAQTKNGPIEIELDITSPSNVAPGVLLTGGQDWTGKPLKTAEIWSPSTQKSTAVGSMQSARYGHTATPLINSKVIVAGGLDSGSNPLQSTELYDEVSQTFTPGPDLKVARGLHTATLLPDGTVLLAGGEVDAGRGAATATAEVYDPVANATTKVSDMSVARLNHTAALMSTGDVLICGGSPTLSDPAVANCEIYYPDQKRFRPVDSTGLAGITPQASATLPGGQVVLVGDNPGVPSYTTSLFTPASSTFSRIPTTPGIVFAGVGTALVSIPANEAFSIGGPQNSGSFNAYYDGQFHPNAGQMKESRPNPVALYLQNTNTTLDGKIAIFGGVKPNTGGTNGTLVEEVDPSGDIPFVTLPLGYLTTPRSSTTATLITTPVTPALDLTSSANPAITGTDVTFTASLSSPGTTATGSVIFTLDGSSTPAATVPLLNGSATYTNNSLSIGSHTITATYTGGAGLSGTTASLIQGIKPNPVTASINNLILPVRVPYGTSTVTLHGMVSGGTPANPIYPAPGEQVTITIGPVTYSTAIETSGKFSFAFPLSTSEGPLDSESYPITYAYSGNTQLREVVTQYGTMTIDRLATTLTPISVDPIPAGTQSISVGGRITAQNYNPIGNVSIAVMQGSKVFSSATAEIQTNGKFATELKTQSLPPGTYTILFQYDETTNFTSAVDSTPLVVNAFATSTALIAAPATWYAGQPVTFTATVTSPGGVPGGTVTFMNDSTTLGTASLNNGVATYTAGTLPAGSAFITATYNASPYFESSISPKVEQLVSRNSSQFTGLSASQTVPYGTQSVRLTGMVWAPDGPAGIAATTIQGSQNPDAGVFFENLDANGISTDAATFGVWINTTVKSQQMILAEPHSNPVLYLQNDQIGLFWEGAGGPADGWLSADTTPVSDGQWHHIAVTLNQGKITFYKDGVATADSFTVASSGSADSAVNFGGGGWKGITSFVGQMWNAEVWAKASSPADIQAQMFPNYNGNYPAALRVLSSFSRTAPSATNLVDGSAARVVEVSFAATTLPFAGQYPSTSETFNVALQTASAHTLASEPTKFGAHGAIAASIPVSSLAPGTYQISYSYDGNAVLLGTSNNKTTLKVDKAPSSTTLSSTPNPSAPNQQVTFNAVVTASGGSPTGTVTFKDGDTTLYTQILNKGAASYTTKALTPGIHNITADYSGDSNFLASSDTITQTVNKAASNTEISSTLNPSTLNQQVAFTATVTGSGVTPTGSVTFLDGATTLRTVNLTKGIATYSPPSLAVGSHTITARYSGDSNFNSSSDTITQVVNPAASATVITLTANPNPAAFGSTVTFTAKVTTSDGTPVPTGYVIISEPLGTDDVPNYGTGYVNNGVATIVWDPSTNGKKNTLTPGTHYLSANYGGGLPDYPDNHIDGYEMIITNNTTPSGGEFDFSKGFSAAQGKIELNGSTQLEGSRLQLTNHEPYKAGSAFYKDPVNIQAFTTDFTFRLVQAKADGITFTIQNSKPNALGSNGSGLGYEGIDKSVAIKFDLYNNAGEGSNSTGVYTNGEMPELPAIDLTKAGIDLHCGHSIKAHILYDGIKLHLVLTDMETRAKWSHAFTVNIPALVGEDTAWVGFTGGTGAETATQEISAWTYGPAGD